MNIADVIIVFILSILIIAALVFIFNRRRKNKGCCFGCENCAIKCDKRKYGD